MEVGATQPAEGEIKKEIENLGKKKEKENKTDLAAGMEVGAAQPAELVPAAACHVIAPIHLCVCVCATVYIHICVYICIHIDIDV